VPVLIAVAIATCVVVVVLMLAARSGRVTDPADVRAGSDRLADQAVRHPRFAEFLLDRRDTSRATGLLLSVALAASAFAAIVVGLLLQMVQSHEGFARWDMSAARWGAEHTTGSVATVVKGITQIGGTVVVIIVAVVVGIIEYRRLHSRAAPIFIATVVISELIVNNAIKLIVRRDRPNIARLVHASGYSFPSGHTAAAAATYAAVALLLGRRRSRRVRGALAGIAGGLTIAVASSRVLLGAHWLTDVIAGAAVGWGCFALCSIAFGGRLLHFGEPVEAAIEEITSSDPSASAADTTNRSPT
jgi:membrane-associated phospholipid phosphatase